MNPTYTIRTLFDIPGAIKWATEMITQALRAGVVVMELRRETRSNDQNSKMWPMLTDISKHVVWFERKFAPEDWKDILSAAWKGQELVPGVNGGFVALGVRTSKISKPEFSEFIESLYAFGADHDVPWSEKSLEVYETYREAA